MKFTLHSQLEQDTVTILDLNLCKLLLMKDANFRWFILVPMVIGAREIIDLEAKKRVMLFDEICKVSEIIKDIYKPYKLNVANIGNKVEQLHVHLIARFKDDPLFPKPIWENDLQNKSYTTSETMQILDIMKNRLLHGKN